MIRNCSLDEISDGKLYGLNDMVKADCNDCIGCSSCCRNMGDTVILDPLDVFIMVKNIHLSFEELLKDHIELGVDNGAILPHLKMSGTENKCTFLNEEGRCSIHAYRPSVCRLFPLGRYYENNDFKYFLQTEECKKNNRSKVKVSKWIDTENLKENQKFIRDWHYFVKEITGILNAMEDETKIKQISMFILNVFYIRAYNYEIDFYQQFYERLNYIKSSIQG